MILIIWPRSTELAIERVKLERNTAAYGRGEHSLKNVVHSQLASKCAMCKLE